MLRNHKVLHQPLKIWRSTAAISGLQYSGQPAAGSKEAQKTGHQNFPGAALAALAQALFAERVCLANWCIESNSHHHNKGLHPTHFAILFLPEPGSSG